MATFFTAEMTGRHGKRQGANRHLARRPPSPIRIDAGSSWDKACGDNRMMMRRNEMTMMTVIGSLTLPGVERSVAYARRFVGDMLGQDHRRFDDARMVAGELVTNSITHSRSGQGGFVTVALDGGPGRTIQIRVIDDGSDTAKPCVHEDLYAENGRGLLIVQNLADEWGVEVHDDATTIWARLDFPDSAV
jgi:anti-sigma regulatory factor (Ser/Thr protein kinase)